MEPRKIGLTEAEIVGASQPARRDYYSRYHDLYQDLVDHGQKPELFLITCSDSRVSAAGMVGAIPGEMFVVRTAGAVVPPHGSGDRGVAAAIEFAVNQLAVRHIIICGHTDCGAVQALDSGVDMSRAPSLALWIEYLRPAQTSVDARASFTSRDARHAAIVEQTVLLQLRNLEGYPGVRDAQKTGALNLHGWVYHLQTGQVSYWDREAQEFVLESNSDAGEVVPG